MHGAAAKDEKGLPPNMVPPRSGWAWAKLECPARHVFHVRVHRQRYKDIVGQFSGGAFIHKWWSWQVSLCLMGQQFILWRWRERWAV